MTVFIARGTDCKLLGVFDIQTVTLPDGKSTKAARLVRFDGAVANVTPVDAEIIPLTDEHAEYMLTYPYLCSDCCFAEPDFPFTEIYIFRKFETWDDAVGHIREAYQELEDLCVKIFG